MFAISWVTPLTRTERRWLRCWLDRLAATCPGPVEYRRGSLTVRGGSPEAAHSFAALTTAIIGRPRFAYVLAEMPRHAPGSAAA